MGKGTGAVTFTVRQLNGLRFGRLTVIDGPKQFAFSECFYWLTQCDCGNRSWVRADSLMQSRTRSCGCLRAELARDRIRDVHQSRRDRASAKA